MAIGRTNGQMIGKIKAGDFNTVAQEVDTGNLTATFNNLTPNTIYVICNYMDSKPSPARPVSIVSGGEIIAPTLGQTKKLSSNAYIQRTIVRATSTSMTLRTTSYLNFLTWALL